MKRISKYKEKVLNVIKNNKELLLGMLVVSIISATTVEGATILFSADEVSYDDVNVGEELGTSNVQAALDKIYEKEMVCNGKEVVFINEDEDTHQPISGSTFSLTGTTSFNATYTQTATADERGIVTFIAPKGTYTITQTSAPAGYTINNSPMSVTVS